MIDLWSRLYVPGCLVCSVALHSTRTMCSDIGSSPVDAVNGGHVSAPNFGSVSPGLFAGRTRKIRWQIGNEHKSRLMCDREVQFRLLKCELRRYPTSPEAEYVTRFDNRRIAVIWPADVFDANVGGIAYVNWGAMGKRIAVRQDYGLDGIGRPKCPHRHHHRSGKGPRRVGREIRRVHRNVAIGTDVTDIDPSAKDRALKRE